MSTPGSKPELQDPEIIRAYLEETARTRAPIQLLLGDNDCFNTTLEQVGAHSLTTRTTPPLADGKVLDLAFMLEARRLVGRITVLATGEFSMPEWLVLEERRRSPRGAFEASERAEALAVEALAGSIAAGRFLCGKLLDLGAHGLRVRVEEVGSLAGPFRPFQRGDRLEAVSVTRLPFLPEFRARGQVAHLTQGALGLTLGLRLDDLAPATEANLARILERRVPPTFGQAFPPRKRKVDLADLPGPPTPTRVRARPAAVVRPAGWKPAPPPAKARPARPPLTAVMRLRKASRRILVLSETEDLAAALRQEGFRQVERTAGRGEARVLAGKPFDLVLLDLKLGGLGGRDLLRGLRAEGLLRAARVILVAECHNEGTAALAEALEAVHVHARRDGFEALVPVLYRELLER